jgi:hypothetical protein
MAMEGNEEATRKQKTQQNDGVQNGDSKILNWDTQSPSLTTSMRNIQAAQVSNGQNQHRS